MKYFKISEFECNCGCGTNNMDMNTVSKLNDAREYSGIPYNLNSACRCPEHNENEGASSTSSHVATKNKKCKAVDIRCDNSPDRLRIVNGLIKAGFTRIGIAKTFVHADTEGAKPDAIWLY